VEVRGRGVEECRLALSRIGSAPVAVIRVVCYYHPMMGGRLFSAAAVAYLCLVQLLAQTNTPAGPNAAETVRDLLRSLWVYEEHGRPSTSAKIGFQLPENILNLYLAASLASRPRPMIDSMHVRLLPENRCIVDAKINLDTLHGRNAELFTRSERRRFTGSKLLQAEFHFSLRSGSLVFSAKPLKGEVTPSQSLLMKIIRVIALNQPEEIDATRKIPVPFGLRKLWTMEGVLCGET